jgi:hypothetical protein
MRWPFVIVFVLCSFANATSAPAPIGVAPFLELRLRAATTKAKDGKRSAWEVVIVNRGRKPVTLVHPGDGSESGWRTPIIEWVIDGKVERELGGEVVVLKKGEKDAKPELKPVCLTDRCMRLQRCGNIGALKASDVFDLLPGKEVKFTSDLYPPTLWKGTRKVAVRYFHIPTLKWRGLPLKKHDEKAMERIKKSAPVTLESNTVEVVVQP